MTSPTVELAADVHVPPCSRQRCGVFLNKISKALLEKNLKCVTEYKICGTYLRSFSEAFENCPYTIIHRCKKLWDQICELESIFSENDSKIIVIDFSKKSRSDSGYESQKNYNFNKFFLKFSSSCITDEKNFNAFISRVENLFTRPLPDSTNTQTQQESQASTPDEDTNLGREDKYECYLDLFGDTSYVFVKESCVNFTDLEITENLKVHEWADIRNRLFKEQFTCRKKYAIHKVLPALYKGRKAAELSYIASCCDTDLQGEAMILLETLLLSKNYDDKEFSLNREIHLESLLFESLHKLSKRWAYDKNVSLLIERLSSMYMLVISNMIMSCKEKDHMEILEIHFSTIIARGSNFDQACNELHVFIEDLKSNPCSQVKNSVHKFISTDTQKMAAKLWSSGLLVQACVFTEVMKQMFQSGDLKNLTLLNHYMEAKNAQESKKTPPASMTLLMRCLTIFLTYGLKKKKHQNLQSIYQEALKIITSFLGGKLKSAHGKTERTEEGWILTEDMYRFMQMLLFDNNLVIQKEIFLQITNVEGNFRSAYGSNQLPFLLNQLKRLLIPFLEIERSWMVITSAYN